ncbi:hypothetical protein F5051DRAFT_432857 [Lentinula edodes]|uniref:uncharacterized protein n=1 Tax=Lentinula edodes TaxID=5353 RepID=UPI001E8DDB02|nr:uncharacterized protein C8R40DRAFT_1068821 [Lentinula edodes]XP_046089474.1 uncharacterized protein C8R40DRAFT_1067388 [Lentinula edodes]KAH7876525.1 hypothetical protein C8R40DRAFT_1068821 [Lentinula edodes]KAH7878380.1 hypothetical protein C8R40DRAFT_1067388 [Lentinula edodes]KAJ3872644.1 hypothetical protein F5051DRAFT_432857 [Lentinula edodes]
MPLTYFQQLYEESWVQTDDGIDEEAQDPQFSREIHKTLRTKFLWHFVPTYLTVQGTQYEQAFLIYASAIWASHWPEDVTYGEKSLLQRTALMKRVVYPPEFSSGNLDIEDLELHLGIDEYEAQAIKKTGIAQATLYTFFSARLPYTTFFIFELTYLLQDNIQSYQQTLREYTNDEAGKMWYQMFKSIRKFLSQAVVDFGPYISLYGLPASDWKRSLNEAVTFWDLHNHLPASFLKEFSWPRYRYLIRPPENERHRLLAWEYPCEGPDQEIMVIPPPWLPLNL